MRLIFKYILTFALFFASFSFCFSQSTLDIDKLDDAVVVVVIYDYYGNYLGHGSGFFISSTGTVVTNYHVIAEACSAEIITDIAGVKKTYSVDKVISGDKEIDLAKLSIKNPNNIVFPYLVLASNYPKKGEDCWAIGAPADILYMNTVSKGIVSNLYFDGSPKMIQTNAEVTHGSSGGPLISITGKVIGVTNGIDPSLDGNRASINFAIWIGELSNIPSLNKALPINPNLIPCQVSFYTNCNYQLNAWIYVDGTYIGSLSEYFKNDETPVCGQNGTLTRYLSAGTHQYRIFYSKDNSIVSGSFTLSSGGCVLVKVNAPESKPQSTYNPPSNNSNSGNNNTSNYPYTPSYTTVSKNFVKINNDFLFMLSIGAHFNTFMCRTYPIFIPPIVHLDTYLGEKHMSARLHFSFLYRKPDYSHTSFSFNSNDYYMGKSTLFYSYGLDWKFIGIPTISNRHFYLCAYLHRFKGVVDYSRPYFVTGQYYTTTYYNEIYTYGDIDFGFKIGGEKLWSKRFNVTTECGLGYLFNQKSLILDFNILFGLRFFDNS